MIALKFSRSRSCNRQIEPMTSTVAVASETILEVVISGGVTTVVHRLCGTLSPVLKPSAGISETTSRAPGFFPLAVSALLQPMAFTAVLLGGLGSLM